MVEAWLGFKIQLRKSIRYDAMHVVAKSTPDHKQSPTRARSVVMGRTGVEG